MLSNRGLGIQAKKCQYEGVILPTAVYKAEAWGMRSAEGKKEHVLDIKFFKKLVGVSRMDRVWNEEVHRRAEIEQELASRADQSVEMEVSGGSVQSVEMEVEGGYEVDPGLAEWMLLKVSSGRRGIPVKAVRQ